MKRLIIIFSLFGSFFFAQAQVDDMFLAKPKKLTLRSEANKKSKSLGWIAKGTELHITAVQGNWYHVKYGQHEGWAKKNELISKKENSFARFPLQTGEAPEGNSKDLGI